jgi:hypothetical protein
MKKKQTAVEGTEVTVEEVERQIRESEKEIRHRGGTECRMDNECMGQKK